MGVISEEIRPTESEILFLNLAFNKFYDIYEEMFGESFWDEAPYYRFSKVKSVFAIYAEILNYEPIKWAGGHGL